MRQVLWLPFLRAQQEPTLVAAARREGVGVYPVGPLFAPPSLHERPRSAGLILGYASLTIEQIQQGISILASVIAGIGAR